jgi:serine/threonine-protein kinase
MATIRLAQQAGPHGLSRIVAVKQLHQQFASNDEFVAMFRDEIRVATRVVHPNVVPILDVVSAQGELLLVLEYVHGESLSRLQKGSRAPVPPEIASTIVVGILHGLHAAHEARSELGEPLHIVHRDVTPHNVVIGVDGSPRILDFGIAHAVGRMQTTKGGQIKGKLAYMSPEQLRLLFVDRRTDVYSVSVVLWEMLTGRKLFVGRNRDEVARSILKKVVERPSEVQPGISAALDAIVLRGLDRDPESRFATAREMAVALEERTVTVSATHLGQWVRDVWGQVGEERAQRIRAIEQVGEALPGDAPSDSVDVDAGDSHAANHSMIGTVPDVRANVVPWPAPPSLGDHNDDRPLSKTVPPISLGSRPPAPLRSRWVASIGTLVALSVATYFVLLGPAHRSHTIAEADMKSSARPRPSAALNVQAQIVHPPMVVKVSRDPSRAGSVPRPDGQTEDLAPRQPGDRPSDDAVATARPSAAQPTESSAVKRRTRRASSRTTGGSQAHVPSSPSGAAGPAGTVARTPSCDPPFVMDGFGIKRFKLSCL